MSMAALIRSMASAGASAEAIALAVEAVERAEDKIAVQRAAARDRKRRSRAGQSRDEGVTVTGQERDEGVTVTAENDPVTGQSPETKVSPTPPSKTQTPIAPSPPKGGSVPKPKAEPWDADEWFPKAWLAYPQSGRERSSRKQAWPWWQAAARKVGAGKLSLAVYRFVSEDKQHKADCGAPAFHRWLRDERYEHWLEGPVQAPASMAWSGPPSIRGVVVTEMNDAFARAYLDPSEWIEPQGEGQFGSIRPRNGYAFDKLRTLRCLGTRASLLQPPTKEQAA